METDSNRSTLITGGLLVVLGVVFLGAMLFQQALGGLDWENHWHLIIHPSQPVRYRITVKDLSDFTISGSGDAKIGPLQTRDLDVQISGSGSVGYYGDPQVRHSGETGQVNQLGSK